MQVKRIVTLAALACLLPASPATAQAPKPVPTAAEASGQVAPEAAALVDQATQLADQGQFDEALAGLDRALEIEPLLFEAWAMRGWVLAQLNQAADAMAAFARADALAPDQPMTMRGRGFLALRQGDNERAIGHFTRSLEGEPGNAYALYHRATAHGGIRQFSAALADAEAAIAADPFYLPAYLIRVAALAELGRPNEALAGVDAMLAALPGDPQAQAAASELLTMLGQEERADSMHQASLESGETAVGLYNAAMRREISETPTKLAELDRALELAPGFSLARFERARTLWSDYRLREALADLDTLVERDPLFFAAYDLRGQILFEQGRHADIAALAEGLVESYPDNADALGQAIALLANVERYTRARELREALRAIAPDHPFALTQGNSFFPGQ